MTQSYLVLTALGPDRPGLVRELSEFVAERGVNIDDSRMAILGAEFGGVALVVKADVLPNDITVGLFRPIAEVA